MKKKLIEYSHILLLSIFIIGSFLFIESNFKYWYSFMEQYMMFLTTGDYFFNKLAEPGGLNEYLTEFITLSFVYPFGAALSISVILGSICACFYLYLKSFHGKPSMFLSILPAFLFWIYPQESIASLLCILVALSFATIYTRLKSNTFRYLFGFVFLTLTYFSAAPSNLLLALLIGLYECCTQKGNIRFATTGFAIAYSGILPLVAMRTCYIIPMPEAFLSKHLYHPEFPFPISLLWIGLSFPIITLVAYLNEKKPFIKNANLKFVITSLCLLGGIIAGILYKKDPLEQAYRYDYYARQNKWDEIVAHAKEHSVHDLDALVYLNLALSHTGEFIDKFLQFPQYGEAGFIPQDPRSRMGLIQASEVAWQIGQINASQRFAFVGVLSSERLVQPRLMKRLVETYLISGEYRAAEKYIKLLELTPHYRNWATQQRALLDPEVCSSTKWVAQKRKFLPITDNPFDLTKTLPSALAFLIDDHPDNRPAFEYGMGYLLANKDLGTLMHYMQLMKERGESFPVRYQEAICFFYSAVHKDPEAFNSYPIAPEVKNRYMRYLQYAKKFSAATLKPQFGDTYYYYLQFAPNLNKQ